MPDALRFAVSTLTVLPARPRRQGPGRAMELAPLVGLLLGLLAGAALVGFRVVDLFPLLPCVLAIALLALLTRGLHLDGLADLADGLGSHAPPERARAVMKDPGVGAFGVAWLLFVPLTQVAALLACVQQGRGTASLVLAVATGRLAITAACQATAPATPEGLGALVAGTVRRGVTSLWLLLLSAAAAGYAFVDSDSLGEPAVRAVLAALAPVAALLIAKLVRAHAVRRVGGLTGDVLGALCELATTVCLVVLALRVA